MPNIPIANSFAPLRFVRRNAPTAQLRRAWEAPGPDVTQALETAEPINQVSWAQKVKKAYQEMKQKQSRKRKVVGLDSPNTQEKPVKNRLTYLPGDRRAPRASKYQAARAQNKPNLKWVERNKTERPVFERLGPKEDKPKNPP